MPIRRLVTFGVVALGAIEGTWGRNSGQLAGLFVGGATICLGYVIDDSIRLWRYRSRQRKAGGDA